MFRFTIRDMLWLMVFVGFGAAWLHERHARIAAEERLSISEFWGKALERAMEVEGYYAVGASFGVVDLVRLPADFPKGLAPAEKRLRLREVTATSTDESHEE